MNYVAITLVSLAVDLAFTLFIAGIIRAGQNGEGLVSAQPRAR